MTPNRRGVLEAYLSLAFQIPKLQARAKIQHFTENESQSLKSPQKCPGLPQKCKISPQKWKTLAKEKGSKQIQTDNSAASGAGIGSEIGSRIDEIHTAQ